MKLRYFFLFVLLISIAGFIEDKQFIKISREKVDLKIPKQFSKPIYDLKKNKVTSAGFILGRKLFYDPILSSDNITSCASCHQSYSAFAHTDHALSHGTMGKIGNRNVPALQNLIWKDSYMADGGITHLDLQPIAPLTNPIEMNETLGSIIHKLENNKEYVALFYKAYGDSVITTEKLLKSFSQFLVCLISDKSRYDLFIRGKEKFNELELSGLKLFRSRCANCHPEPLFTDNSYRNIGLNPYSAVRDSGRQKITGLENDYMRFKVPSLRNTEVTYPYMHDGRFRNLGMVLDHYSKGNFYTANVDSTVKKNVGLMEIDKKAIIAFLKTLTDTAFLNNKKFSYTYIK